MFKKILFPTDFSDVSRKAVKYIKQLKGAGAQEVIVLHVIKVRHSEVLYEATGMTSPARITLFSSRVTA